MKAPFCFLLIVIICCSSIFAQETTDSTISEKKTIKYVNTHFSWGITDSLGNVKRWEDGETYSSWYTPEGRLNGYETSGRDKVTTTVIEDRADRKVLKVITQFYYPDVRISGCIHTPISESEKPKPKVEYKYQDFDEKGRLTREVTCDASDKVLFENNLVYTESGRNISFKQLGRITDEDYDTLDQLVCRSVRGFRDDFFEMRLEYDGELLMKSISYDLAENLVTEDKYVYKDGLEIRWERFNNGKLAYFSNSEYEFDAYHNWIKCTSVYDDHVEIVTRRISYY